MDSPLAGAWLLPEALGFSPGSGLTARVLDKDGSLVAEVHPTNGDVAWDGTDLLGQPVANGPYTLLVEGRDAVSGTTVAFEGFFVVDNVPPAGQIVRLEGGNAGDRVIGTVTDGSLVLIP